MSSAGSAVVASSSSRSPSSASQQPVAASGTTELSHAPISENHARTRKSGQALDRGQFIASPPLSQRSSERKLSGPPRRSGAEPAPAPGGDEALLLACQLSGWSKERRDR